MSALRWKKTLKNEKIFSSIVSGTRVNDNKDNCSNRSKKQGSRLVHAVWIPPTRTLSDSVSWVQDATLLVDDVVVEVSSGGQSGANLICRFRRRQLSRKVRVYSWFNLRLNYWIKPKTEEVGRRAGWQGGGRKIMENIGRKKKENMIEREQKER